MNFFNYFQKAPGKGRLARNTIHYCFNFFHTRMSRGNLDPRGQPAIAHHQNQLPISCCVGHDSNAAQQQLDPAVSILREKYFSVCISHKGVAISVCFDCFAPTQALRALAEAASSLDGPQQKELTISSMKLCKMHRDPLAFPGGKGCKLGPACRNIHLCRKVALIESTTTTATLSASATVLPPLVPGRSTPPPSFVCRVKVNDEQQSANGPLSSPSTKTPATAKDRVIDSTDELLTIPASAAPGGCSTPTPPSALLDPANSKKSAEPKTPSNSCIERFARRWQARRSGGGTPQQVASSTGSSVERVQNIVDAVFLAPRPPTPNGDVVLCADDDPPPSVSASNQNHSFRGPALPQPEKSTSPVPRPPRGRRLGSSASRDRTSILGLKGSGSIELFPDSAAGPDASASSPSPQPSSLGHNSLFAFIPASPPSPVARTQYKRVSRSLSAAAAPASDVEQEHQTRSIPNGTDRQVVGDFGCDDDERSEASRNSSVFESAVCPPARARTVPAVTRALHY